MSAMTGILTIVCVFVFIVVVCAAAVWVEKKFPGKEYDERQKVARGRGYRLSFWVGFAYFVGVAFILLHQVDGEKTIEPYLLVFIGVILQAMVNHTYCLMTHSALPLSQNRLWAIFGYVVCGTLQFCQFHIWQERDGLSFIGHGSAAWGALIAGCCFFYLVVLHIIQILLEWKE
ncbi:MAG: hypothetical protein E7431_09705 [Ruminococcaceae bacterium]|nr:hypothetical protein [Oscillospiraceae bacterium]